MSQPGLGAMLHYLSGGSQKDPKDYVGKKIKRIELKGDRLEIDFADGAEIDIWDSGQSCCESRYMRTDDNLQDVVGGKLISIEDVDCESPPEGEWGECHDIVMLKIETSKGGVTFSFHNEHNGYYGGFGLTITRRGGNRYGE